VKAEVDTPMEPEVVTPIKGKPTADLRDYLAEERTFLAWIRTGIALMAFGFVLAEEMPILHVFVG